MGKTNLPTAHTESLYYLSLHEVIHSFGTSTETIVEIVNEGIVCVEPIESEQEWQFDNEACRRIRLVLQLHRDLGVNIAGAALALELMHEIDEMHTLLSQR